MKPKNMITDKEQYQKTATHFFNILFAESLRQNCGEIEIKGFEDGPKHTSYYDNIPAAVDMAYNLCQQGLDVYMGVNPRVGQAGSKENVHWLAAFHAEVDYGQAGHNNKPEHDTYDDALAVIEAFNIPPTFINHSGGGFHCYWVLNDPANVSDIGLDALENINRALMAGVKADRGTHNINRILRVPGTFNFKIQGNPRPASIIVDSGPTYDIDAFKPFMDFQQKPKSKVSVPVSSTAPSGWDKNISSLPVSSRIQFLIVNGNDGSYPSRSEADQAVITALVNKGVSDFDIKAIFENYMIGEKYRGHSSPDDYLKYNIKKAKEFSHLNEEERQDPLFISGALHKDDKGKYHLKIVPFQEFMNKKHMLKFLEKERTFFRYNGQCYEECSDDRLNNICQNELDKHRELFTPSSKANFIHFAIGNDLVNMEKAFKDQILYLTLQNGLYDLSKYKLISHDAGIFTTNLLPYDYDPDADCPRWLQYLDEVFLSDSDAATILFVQEAVGYAFHKSIPKAVLFFLIGDGGNGKSVFIDVISSLCGKDNVCNISLNRLNDEKYLPELFGKMINVSGETPSAKQMNTDLIKSVVGGDWVTGREVYKKPSKFKPYAKHYLGMNTLPEIEDNTHGMWRRIHVIEFPRKFSESEMDVELTGTLIDELSGIFNWALEGYRRLRDQEFIFSKSPSMQKSKRLYKQKNSSVIDFIESHFVTILAVNQSVPFKGMYEQYRSFCLKEGIKQISSKKDFRSMIESEGFLIENSSKHANQLRIFEPEIAVLN